MAATIEPSGHREWHIPGVPHAPPKRTLWQRITSRRFLFISIIAHVFFGLVAAAYIVETSTVKSKRVFTAARTSPSKRDVEHKVQMVKKRNMSAPAQSKRVTTTALSKFSLPKMPAMPAMSAAATVAPGPMAGMGAAGAGLGLSAGALRSSGGGIGGGSVPLFGFHQAPDGSLMGNFYDLKQDKGHKPTGMNTEKYYEVVGNFIKNGWATAQLNDFYKASNKLYTTQFFIPDIDANEGPKAFGVEKEVEPKWYIAHYAGKVTPAESGTFYFVGMGDDVLCVKFNGKTVLDGSWGANSSLAKKEATYDYGWPTSLPANQFVKGEAIHVESGRPYPMEVLIGECPGGSSHYILLIEKQGEIYQRDGKGNPILPVFQLANANLPTKGNFPKVASKRVIWEAEKASTGAGSALDIFRSPSPAP